MTDTHPTDIDVHRGANQSIITAEIADTELAVLVAEGADIGPGAFTNALDDVIGALSERVATESGFYGDLPPVEQVEQELATDGGQTVPEALAALDEGDHAELELAEHGSVAVYVTDITTKQDGLAGVAKTTIDMATLSGARFRVVIEFDAGPHTCELEFAVLIADGEEQFVDIERVAAASQQTLIADGAGHYTCALCDRRHPTTGAALECCSDRFDDTDLLTDGGTTALEPITLDDIREGDRVRVSYDIDRSETGRVSGEIVEVEPSVTNHREVRSAILDAENGRQYRVLFGGGVSEVHADNEVVVGHSASLHREVDDER